MASVKAVLGGQESENELDRVNLAAQGALVATWAAVCWVVLGVESIVRPQQVNFRDAIWMIPFSLTAAAFVYLHLLQRSRARRFEAGSFYFLMIASALTFLGNVGMLMNIPWLAKLGFPIGAVLWMAGLIAFGIATWITKTVPWYVGLSLILLEPGSLLTGIALSPIAPLHDRGAYSAGVEKGLALAIVAFALSRLKNMRWQMA